MAEVSHTQYEWARVNRGEFWLYIVENAVDPLKANLFAIKDPVGKADKYLFDDEWRLIADRPISVGEMALEKGQRIKVRGYRGEGTILRVYQRGLLKMLEIDFDELPGTKNIQLNISTLTLL